MPRFDLNDYVSVQERITRFWSENPNGRIATALESSPDEYERVVFKTAIYKHRDYAEPDATGWAAEQAGGTGANQSFAHENCETSSIGRALANMGYATSQRDRPSREEMVRVNDDAPQRTTTAPAPQAGNEPTPRQLGYLHKIAREAGLSDEQVEQRSGDTFGAPVAMLDRRDLSKLIEMIQAERNAHATQ